MLYPKNVFESYWLCMNLGMFKEWKKGTSIPYLRIVPRPRALLGEMLKWIFDLYLQTFFFFAACSICHVQHAATEPSPPRKVADGFHPFHNSVAGRVEVHKNTIIVFWFFWYTACTRTGEEQKLVNENKPALVDQVLSSKEQDLPNKYY